jgi:hypothetical protein
MNIVKFNAVEERIITIRDTPVLLVSDVAYLYGVETREINQAVKNNPNKFPNKEYVFELAEDEKTEVIKNFDNPKVKFSPKLPTAFTEKGLYMLETILKGEKAEETTLDIIETFTKIRELTRTVNQITKEPDEQKQKSLTKRCGEIITSILSDDLEVTSKETTIELNLAMVLKIKHTTKKRKKDNNE